jgi:LEA14-like dessication related protein
MSADERSSSIVRSLGVLTVALILVLAVVAGAFAFDLVGQPTVVSSESRFAEVGPATTTIRTDIVIANPNPIGLNRGDATVSHTVRMNDVAVAAGTDRGLSLPPGRSTREITTRLNNSKIPRWWVSHVRNGERTQVTVRTQVSGLFGEPTVVPRRETIETDLLAAFNSTETRPVNADVPFRSGPVLYVNRTNASWGTVSETETPIDATLGVYNPLPVPVPITELGYTIRMNGVRVGNGTTDRTYILDSGRVTDVGTNATVDATRLDEWWVTHLRRNQSTTVTVDFSLRVDLPVVGNIRLPLDGVGYTTEFETDLLGTKNGSVSSDRSGATAPSRNPTAGPWANPDSSATTNAGSKGRPPDAEAVEATGAASVRRGSVSLSLPG